MSDYSEVQYDVFRNLKSTYTSHLKKFITENNCSGVEHLLNQMVVPEEVLNYRYLHNSSQKVLEILIESKRQYDEFVENALKLFGKKKFHDIVDLNCITAICNDIQCKYSDENYKTFLLLNILNDRSYTKTFCVGNIICNYKNLKYYYEKIICDGLYYANKDFVEMLLNIAESNWSISWTFRFKPTSRQSHKDIMKWLIENIRRGNKGQQVGWETGPDSGIWPSTNIQDYVNTIDLIEQYTKLNL